MSLLKPTPEDLAEAMARGLEDRIREHLKARILERIEPDIQAALDSAIEAFKLDVTAWHDMANMRDVVKVIVERRDK